MLSKRPYRNAPRGLRDITRHEQAFARELIALLERHQISYKKIRRLRSSKTPTAQQVCDALVSPNPFLGTELNADVEALLKKHPNEPVLQHSILKLPSGHHFLQHAPKRNWVWAYLVARIKSLLFGRQAVAGTLSRYPAGSFGRLKTVVGVFDNRQKPSVSAVKIMQQPKIDILNDQSDVRAETQGLDAMGLQMGTLTRDIRSSHHRFYLHQVFLEGVNLAQNVSLMRKLGFGARRYYDTVVLSGLANLDVHFSKKRLHLDIKPDNMLVNRKGQLAFVDYGASVPFADNLPGQQQSVLRHKAFRRDELLHDDGDLHYVGPTDDLLAFALSVCWDLGLYKPADAHSFTAIIEARKELPEKLRACRQLDQGLRELLITCLTYRDETDATLLLRADQNELNPLPELLNTLLSPKLCARFQKEKSDVQSRYLNEASGYVQRIAASESRCVTSLNQPDSGFLPMHRQSRSSYPASTVPGWMETTPSSQDTPAQQRFTGLA